jgi:hypothetical protein
VTPSPYILIEWPVPAGPCWSEEMPRVLLTLFHQVHPDADPFQMNIAKFSLETSTIRCILCNV